MQSTYIIRKLSVIALVLLLAVVSLAEAKPAKPAPIKPNVESALSFLRSQIKTTGLVDSFVEDNTDYSYTYDNALAAMAFISAGDFTSAGKILDAFLVIGPQPEGSFLHRYNANSGASDGILSVGHNTYLLQAMNLYYLDTNDPKYNILAQGIANYILTQQAADGGIYGRAGVSWKSTENNLGALLAIHNLGVVQNIPYYLDRAEAIRNFLVTECWDQARFLCGENDPTIVTDVQALGAIVLGTAYKNGAYWIKNYTLTTKRYTARKTITGFDENTDRDTVWTEGTLQESVAFMTAGDVSNFSFYKTEAEKLYQSSGALLAASNTGTTGFGENFQRWQAVAPTAWYVYASNQDNVLALLP